MVGWLRKGKSKWSNNCQWHRFLFGIFRETWCAEYFEKHGVPNISRHMV